MQWSSELEAVIQRDAPLAPHTTFGIGGKADFLISPRDATEFARAYAAALGSGLPVYLLGGGSNLLIADDGVRGVVIRVPAQAREEIVIDGETVVAPAGAALGTLVLKTVRAGLSGLEVLAGIPGTVGGAVVMNAGGRYGCIGDRVTTVWVIDRLGRVLARPSREIRWGYRATDLTAPVAAVEFKLDRDLPAAVERRMAEHLAEKQGAQPLAQASAGSFFKNPPGHAAGRLIEMAGLKGRRRGAACVSDKHANFIVNLGGATAADVLALAGEVRDEVHGRFGKELESEVHFWPGRRV
jgi:UDP-N-acetylmuramate dehydrogenase